MPDAAQAAPVINPNLSAMLRADYEALKNDLEQANELTHAYQRELAGRSNEFADLKRLFERTQADLTKFQADIVELRKERHDLANQVMRGTAYEMKYHDVCAERNRLRVDLERVREALANHTSGIEKQVQERDARIAQLTVELHRLKEQLATARKSPGAVPATGGRPPVDSDTINICRMEFGDDSPIDIQFGA
jgi:chromosome segregation ATPase